MSTAAKQTSPLWEILFAKDGDPTLATYTILDGAACEDLLPMLEEHDPDHCCLYAGDLDDDVEEVAPYLVRLEADHPFTGWLLESIGHQPWGIFCKAPSTLRELRKHFRQFLIVKGPQGQLLYFRYFDPRVLASFSAVGSPANVSRVIGPIAFVVFQNCADAGFTLVIRTPDKGCFISNYNPEYLTDIQKLSSPVVLENGRSSDMIISREEMDAFDKIAARDFRMRANRHLSELFPYDKRVQKPEELEAFVERGVQAAAAKGIELEYDVTRYLELSLSIGQDFPALAWAVPIFEDTGLLPSQKMDQIWEIASDESAAATQTKSRL